VVSSFDELIGAEPAGAERARLRSVHELLIEAGPPPEVPPELEAGPSLAMTLSRFRLFTKRKRLPIITVAAAVIVALVIGISAGLRGGNGTHYPTFVMRGVAFGSGARGQLELLPAKGTTQPMKLEVTGLPAIGKKRYTVYLVRNGARVTSCGSFTISDETKETTVQLTSPYRAKGTDTWWVTVQTTVGTTTVMKPVT